VFRVFLGATCLLLYAGGLLFYMLFKDDLKHFSIGFWTAAFVIIAVAPFLLGLVASMV
jgi:hypothetical protein